MSCVYRASQRFGAKHLIDVLRGKGGERILQYDISHLPTYGIGKQLDDKQWLSVFRQLLARAYLNVDQRALRRPQPGRMVPSCCAGRRAVIRRAGTSPRPKQQRVKPAPPWPSVRTTRCGRRCGTAGASLRKNQGVPPYVIFHDTVLLDMVKQRPRSLTEMGQLSGVGEKKLERYGADFLKVIRPHPEPLPSVTGLNATATETLNLFRRG